VPPLADDALCDPSLKAAHAGTVQASVFAALRVRTATRQVEPLS
jgi:hypothetical protein